MASSALKQLAAVCCTVLLCAGAGHLSRPALALASPPLSSMDQEAAAARLLREVAEHGELAEEQGLGGDGGEGVVGDLCPAACQTCLVVCAVTCVLNKEPIACFANCTVSSACFRESTPLAA